MVLTMLLRCMLLLLSQEDDVRKYVVTYQKERTDKNGKKHTKAPKIQR